MPGKAGRSGRPKGTDVPKPVPDQEQKPHKKRGRPPKRSCTPEHENKSNFESGSVMKSMDEPDKQTSTKPVLRPKSGRESFKDSVIGKAVDVLPMTKLPIKQLILQRARALRYENEQFSDRRIAQTIAEEVVSIWNRAAIPCMRTDNILTKILKTMDEFGSLMKHWERLRPEQEPLKSFLASLEQLYDVAFIDLQQRMVSSGNPSWREDYEFYLNQKKVPQVGAMCGKDKVLDDMIKRRYTRDSLKETREKKAAETQNAQFKTVTETELATE